MYGVQASINTKAAMAVGELFWFAGSAVPDKCLACDGSAVSRTTYAKLFAVIGTLWDNTDGAASPAGTDFRVPPSRITGSNIPAFLQGKGSGDTVGSSLAGQNKSHTHTADLISNGNHRHVTRYGTQSVATDSNQNKPLLSSTSCTYNKNSGYNGTHSHTLTVATQGGTVPTPESARFRLMIYSG